MQAQNNQLSADGESQATAQEVGAAFKENYKGAFPNLTIYSDHKEMLAKDEENQKEGEETKRLLKEKDEELARLRALVDEPAEGVPEV